MSFQADIAQLVEQRIRNAKVVGSTPIIGTIKINKLHIISTFLIFDWDKFGTDGFRISLFAVRVR